jgi:hypothetical protein
MESLRPLNLTILLLLLPSFMAPAKDQAKAGMNLLLIFFQRKNK